MPCAADYPEPHGTHSIGGQITGWQVKLFRRAVGIITHEGTTALAVAQIQDPSQGVRRHTSFLARKHHPDGKDQDAGTRLAIALQQTCP